MNIPTERIFIPEALKALNNWCVWKLEQCRDGRNTKIPYSRTGHKASSTNRASWNTFDTMTQYLSEKGKLFSGLGFMISDGLIFIDIDHCIATDGSIDERGKDVLSAFPESYAEISQSGEGLHILTRGRIPKCFNNRKCGVEMYDASRFVAITGNAIQALEPTEEQDGIDYCFNKYSTRTGNTIGTYSEPLQTGISTNSDKWVISHAMNIQGQQGRDFRTLFEGDTSAYESASEADQALCTLLAFWTDRDMAQMDRIFRQSGLYRPKWERQDYRVRTLTHAVQHIPESLSEWHQRHQKEVQDSASVMQFLECGGDAYGR